MVLQAVSLDQWKRCDPLGILFYNVERKLCIAVVTAIVMTLRSLIKTESRTAKLRQVDSHCRGLTGKTTSEWMNQSLLLCSLPVCPFLILSFQVVCFWEKNPSARLCMLSLHVTSQVSRYLDGSFQLSLSPETDIWKNSDRIPIFCTSSWSLFAYLCQWTQRRISCNTFFFAKHTYLLELHLELNSGSSLHLSRSLSLFSTRCAPFRVWSLSAVSSTCIEIKVGQMVSMEVCALRCSLQAWLRNV